MALRHPTVARPEEDADPNWNPIEGFALNEFDLNDPFEPPQGPRRADLVPIPEVDSLGLITLAPIFIHGWNLGWSARPESVIEETRFMMFYFHQMTAQFWNNLGLAQPPTVREPIILVTEGKVRERVSQYQRMLRVHLPSLNHPSVFIYLVAHSQGTVVGVEIMRYLSQNLPRHRRAVLLLLAGVLQGTFQNFATLLRPATAELRYIDYRAQIQELLELPPPKVFKICLTGSSRDAVVCPSSSLLLSPLLYHRNLIRHVLPDDRDVRRRPPLPISPLIALSNYLNTASAPVLCNCAPTCKGICARNFWHGTNWFYQLCIANGIGEHSRVYSLGMPYRYGVSHSYVSGFLTQ